MKGSIGCPTKNLTIPFLKLRAARKGKQNRFRLLTPSGTLRTSSTLPESVRGQHDSSSYTQLPSNGLPTGVSSAASDRSTTHIGTTPSNTTQYQGFDDHHRTTSPRKGEPIIQIELSHTLPPLWLDRVEETNEHLANIKQKLSSLQKLQQKRLLCIFGDHDMITHPEQEVDTLSSQITQLLKLCEKRIFEIGPPPNCSTSEMKLRTNAQKSLAIQVQGLSQEMRLQQKHYVYELRKRHQLDDTIKIPIDDATTATTTTTSQTIIGSESPQEIEQLQVLEGPDELDSKVNRSRNEEITKIAQSMAELQSIFHDLNLLVIDQGTILDRIDFNVEQIAVQTALGTQQLHKAEDRRRHGRAGRVILFLLGLIAFLC